MKKRDIILMIGAISFIVLVVCLALLLEDKFGIDKKVCGCPKVISQNFVWIFIILAVVFAACLLYYLFSLKIDSQKIIMNKNIEILFSILDEDEKKVIKKLIDNNGEMMQSEISESIGKLKSHRVIKKLIEKKIVDAEKGGKTNTIKLKDELLKELV